MFENMTFDERPRAWLEIFILMLVAFLIGYVFAWWFYRSKYNKYLDPTKDKETFEVDQDDKDIEEPTEQIKAILTRDRKGEMVQNTSIPDTMEEERLLDFSRIGKSSEAQKDDLKKIQGIGPVIEKKLNSIGIYTFKQISQLNDIDINKVTELIEFFPGRIKRDNWIDQAKKLAEN